MAIVLSEDSDFQSRIHQKPQSLRAHQTESMSVMGHARSAAVCSTEWWEERREGKRREGLNGTARGHRRGVEFTHS